MTQHYFPVGTGGGGVVAFQIIKTDDKKFKVGQGVAMPGIHEPPEVIGGSNETEFTALGAANSKTYILLELTLDEGDQSITAAEIVISELF